MKIFSRGLALVWCVVMVLQPHGGRGCKKAEVISKEILEEEKEVVEIDVTQDNVNVIANIDDNVEVEVLENETKSDFVDEELSSTVDETEDYDDSQDAFADIEDEGEGVCGEHEFPEKPRKKVLPSAVIIGIKK